MSDRKGMALDPRTKLILLILVNILLLMSHSLWFEIILLGSCLLLVSLGGRPRTAFHFLIAFLIMLGIDRFFVPYMNGFVFTLISFLSFALRKFLPCLIVGKWILDSTEVSEFVAAMRKVHMPQTVIIPLSVVFRYFPAIKEEWTSIRSAMKMRGIHFSFEHIMVPFLMSAVSVSEELSAAALCRGLDNPGQHTCLCRVEYRSADKVVLTVATLLTAAAVSLKAAGIL